jgi:hypothetical protein
MFALKLNERGPRAPSAQPVDDSWIKAQVQQRGLCHAKFQVGKDGLPLGVRSGQARVVVIALEVPAIVTTGKGHPVLSAQGAIQAIALDETRGRQQL